MARTLINLTNYPEILKEIEDFVKAHSLHEENLIWVLHNHLDGYTPNPHNFYYWRALPAPEPTKELLPLLPDFDEWVNSQRTEEIVCLGKLRSYRDGLSKEKRQAAIEAASHIRYTSFMSIGNRNNFLPLWTAEQEDKGKSEAELSKLYHLIYDFIATIRTKARRAWEGQRKESSLANAAPTA